MLTPHKTKGASARSSTPSTNVFETTDFYLACYLRCRGYRLEGVRRDGPRRVFQFEDRAERQDAILSFFNNEGSVRPLAFATAIKDLKALIYNA